jgi:hypothetical protein
MIIVRVLAGGGSNRRCVAPVRSLSSLEMQRAFNTNVPVPFVQA